jgi:hypothetical protein
MHSPSSESSIQFELTVYVAIVHYFKMIVIGFLTIRWFALLNNLHVTPNHMTVLKRAMTAGGCIGSRTDI